MASERVASNEDSLKLSFACAGWLKMYMFGVAQAFKECNLHKTATFAGSSAGSLCGVALAVDADIYAIKDFILDAVDDCRSDPLRKAFQLRQYVVDCFDMNCPENGDKMVNGRVETAVTLLPSLTKRRYRHYRDREHLKKAVLASCCCTPIAGFPFFLDKGLVFDGGVTDFQPLVLGFEQETITINPFYVSRADISPSEYVPVWWAVFPPTRERVEWLFNLGRSDGLRWISENSDRHGIPQSAQKARETYHLHSKRELARQKMLNAGWSLTWILIILSMLIIKPLALMVLYIELWLKFFILLGAAIIKSAFGGGSSTDLFNEAIATLRSIVSPTLLSLYLPVVGRAVATAQGFEPTHRFAKVFQQSFIFRLLMHAM